MTRSLRRLAPLAALLPLGFAACSGTGAQHSKDSPYNIHATLNAPPHTAFRGVWLPLCPGGAIVNLSFGIGVIRAVSDHALTLSDFAATDLAVELLYMIEAKSAVADELSKLTARLDTARLVAEERSITDTLTGLKNRRAMDVALSGMARSGWAFAIMQIDLDYFKSVNDTLGHAAGDHVLQSVANILATEFRPRDHVARVGGDEFVVLLDDVTDTKRLNTIAARLISRIEAPIMFEGKECRVSASIGVAVSDSYTSPDPVEMMADADLALYQSKRQGRATSTIHDAKMPGPQAKQSVR